MVCLRPSAGSGMSCPTDHVVKNGALIQYPPILFLSRVQGLLPLCGALRLWVHPARRGIPIPPSHRRTRSGLALRAGCSNDEHGRSM